MANSALRKDTFVGAAQYLLGTAEPLLPNSIPVDALPLGVAANPDIVLVQKGGLGGLLEGVPVSSFPGGGGGTFPWSLANINTLMLEDNGYWTTVAGPVEFTLPIASAVGTIIRVASADNGFTIKQTAGQQVTFNQTKSTAGPGGSIATTQSGQSIEMLCFGTNFLWQVISGNGNAFTII